MTDINTQCKRLIIAHRGESFDAPENTLEAIQLAWKRDAAAVEIDIQLSLDNQIVVFHDLTTKRIGGRNKKVKKQTLSELRELDVGIHKGDNWKNTTMPTLSEVLETVPGGKKIIIEIKSAAEIIPFLKSEIRSSKLKKEQIEFISFNLPLIAEIKKTMPQYKSLWLLNLDYLWINRIFPPNLKSIVYKTKKYKLDGLNVFAGTMLTPAFAKTIINSKLLLYTWTVNDPQRATYLFNIGVDAVTTDKASFLKEECMAIDAKNVYF
ncbi:glycerophosphodiester phosphodiesterase family protein [uncultured Draconibacterium sp.]|uniref:glycerophosphodiester phosphodiesterase family protein n=1 Tax=uncultured Draconibacterium sp. TaxID=1573823 RepID=UPI003217D740